MAGRTLALGLLTAVLGGGCGTVHNCKQPTYSPPANPDAPVCRVYGGIRGDAAVMLQLPWRNLPSYLDYVVIPAMCAIDLVCTAAGDTVTLPYTGWAEVRRAFFDPPPPEPTVERAPKFAPTPAGGPPVANPEPPVPVSTAPGK